MLNHVNNTDVWDVNITCHRSEDSWISLCQVRQLNPMTSLKILILNWYKYVPVNRRRRHNVDEVYLLHIKTNQNTKPFKHKCREHGK